MSNFQPQASLTDYASLVTALIKSKSLHRASETEQFAEFLQFARAILESGSPTDRLSTVALLGRIVASAKSTKERVAATVGGQTMAEPLAPLRLLGDADDRYYAATVWRLTTPVWLSDFLGSGVVEEDTAETARQECVDGLVAVSSSLSNALDVLTGKLKLLPVQVEGQAQTEAQRKRRGVPGDAVARRMRRILAALNLNLRSNRQFADEAAGKRLRAFLWSAFAHVGAPRDLPAKRDLTQEVYSLILQVVHSRYSLSLNPDTYAAIATVRDWFSVTDWEDFSENENAVEMAYSVQAALELLAVSGRVDNDLFQILALVTAGSQKARVFTRQIVNRNPGLSRDAVAWLTGQPIPKSTALSSESQMVKIEAAIGEAMLANAEASDYARAVQTDLIPQMAIFHSLPSTLLTEFLGSFFKAEDAGRRMAEMRNLETFGSLNEVEEFSPLKHEFVNPSSLGAKLVTVVHPGVSVRLEDGSQRVVVKARVNPA